MTNKLQELLANEAVTFEGELRGAVASTILDNVDHASDLKNFMQDVMQYGCISGCVTGMIYYHETVKFYDEYREFIFDLLQEWGCQDETLEMMGMISDCEDDEEMEEIYDIHADGEKNNIAWMAFEMVLSDLYHELVDTNAMIG